MNPVINLIQVVIWSLLALVVLYWLSRLSKWVRALSRAFVELKERVDCMELAQATKSYLNAKLLLRELRAIEKPTADDYDAINKAEQHIAEFEKKYQVKEKNI